MLSPSDEVYGALFVGLLMAAPLSGISTVQAFTFFKTNPRDPIGHKAAVAFLWLLDTLQFLFTAHCGYHWLITQAQIPDKDLVWSYKAVVFTQVLIIPATEMLYILRVWKLTPPSRKIWPLFLGFLTVVNFGLGMYVPCAIAKLTSLLDVERLTFKFSWSVILDISLMSVTDFLIAGSLIYALHKRGTNLRWTDSSLTMLVAYLLNSGLAVSFLSLATVLVYVKAPPGLMFTTIAILVAKLYVNSFMAMMNARYYLQPAYNNIQETQINLSKLGAMEPRPTQIRNSFTINEVGLPLFSTGTSATEPIRATRMEVIVHKDQHPSEVSIS